LFCASLKSKVIKKELYFKQEVLSMSNTDAETCSEKSAQPQAAGEPWTCHVHPEIVVSEGTNMKTLMQST
jgi:hypothetical protein